MFKKIQEGILKISTFVIVICSLIGACTFLATFIILLCYGHIGFFTDIEFTKMAAVGSFISGIVGVLFTISTTLLVWLTYQSQKQELTETNKIASKQGEIMDLQVKAVQIQSFENTLFQMLNLLKNKLDDIMYSPSDNTDASGNRYRQSVGSNALVVILRTKFVEINSYWQTEQQNERAVTTWLNDENPQDKAKILENYELLFKTQGYKWEDYFKYLHIILKYIDNSDLLDFNKKQFYINVVIGQLSYGEISLLIYHSIHPEYGYNKFMKLIKNYSILENVNKDFLRHKDHYKVFEQIVNEFEE